MARTAKQKAATRKLVALNKRRAGGGSRKRKTATRRSPARRAPLRRSRAGVGAFTFGAPPKTQLAKSVNRLGAAAGNTAMAIGVANPGVAWATGFNVVHPLGGAQAIDTGVPITVGARGGLAGFTSSSLLVKPFSTLALGDGLPAGAPFKDRVNRTIQRVEYNTRAAFTPGHAGAVWGPLGVGLLVKGADMVVTPAIVGLIDGVAGIFPRRR